MSPSILNTSSKADPLLLSLPTQPSHPLKERDEGQRLKNRKRVVGNPWGLAAIIWKNNTLFICSSATEVYPHTTKNQSVMKET